MMSVCLCVKIISQKQNNKFFMTKICKKWYADVDKELNDETMVLNIWVN